MAAGDVRVEMGTSESLNENIKTHWKLLGKYLFHKNWCK